MTLAEALRLRQGAKVATYSYSGDKADRSVMATVDVGADPSGPLFRLVYDVRPRGLPDYVWRAHDEFDPRGGRK